MPVRFLGGGGGGGGSTDVRGILAAPTLTATSATVETTICSWQIPANYLRAKDAISFTLASITSQPFANYYNNVFYVRVGTTGTTTDTLVGTINCLNNGSTGQKGGTRANDTITVEGLLYISNTGSSGGCYTASFCDRGANTINQPYTQLVAATTGTQTTPTTIDTTVPLYITISFKFYNTTNSPVLTPKMGYIAMSL